MPPEVDANRVPDQCLSFTISSSWGHFKRVGRTTTKQTYRIPPRTTVAGMLASIVGTNRDSYYDIFGEDNAAIAITPLSDLRTINIPTVGIGTDPGQDVANTAGNHWSTYTVTYHDTTKDRQLHAYEVLAEPEYRIDVAVEDETFYRTLRDHLQQGTSVYPPSLGKSEYLATIKDVETELSPSRIELDSTTGIDSVVPGSLSDTVPQAGVTYGVERSPAVMEQAGAGRRTTRFDDYIYTQQADQQVRVRSDLNITPVAIESRIVVFR